MSVESYRVKQLQKDEGYSFVCGICAKRHGPKAFGRRDLVFKECETCKQKEELKDALAQLPPEAGK